MAQVNIRVDDALKEQTENILNDLGLNISTAVNIFMRQVIRRGGLPFPVVLNGSETEMNKSNRNERLDYLLGFASKKNAMMGKFERDSCYDR
jgi:DNA-damage-inducible protein J